MHFSKEQQHTEEDEQESDDISTHYEVVECIAEGSFGKVFRCVSRSEQEECAVKLIDKLAVRKTKVDSLRNEARLLEETNHPNIIKLKGFRQTKRHICLEMELIKFGTVGNLIRKRAAQNRPFSSEEISSLMKGILNGLTYLHSLNIVHRDLKTENVLISDPDDLSKVKIADLGLSIKVGASSAKPYDHCGTLLFMAPEVIRKHPYNKPVDVWSCAVILYMLFNQGAHPLGVKSKISSEDYFALMKHRWPKLSDELAQSFIQKLAQYDPVNRYTSVEASRHPFITRNYDDVIPLTCHESFASFMVAHRTSTMIRASFILGELFQRTERMTIEQAYLQKVKLRISQVDEQNELTKRTRQRNVESRRGSKNKGTLSEDANQETDIEARHASGSIQQRDTKESLSPMHRRMLKLINLSFVSQTEDCIKIRDFAEEDKPEPHSAMLPAKKDKSSTGNQSSVQRKVQDFLTTGSLSPVKSPLKKKSIVNFPKLPDMKPSILHGALKKAHSIQKPNEDVDPSPRSPNRRPESSRKYVRASAPDQNAFKVYKS